MPLLKLGDSIPQGNSASGSKMKKASAEKLFATLSAVDKKRTSIQNIMDTVNSVTAIIDQHQRDYENL